MNKEEFRNLLKEASDKNEAIKNNARQFDFSIDGVIDIVNDILTDKEKIEFLCRFKQVPTSLQISVIKTINDDNLKIEAMENKEISDGFSNYYIKEIIESLHDSGKLKLLGDKDLIDQKKLTKYDIANIIVSMSDDSKRLFFDNSELQKSLNFSNFDYTKILCSLKDEDERLKYAEILKLGNYDISEILSKCSDDKKREIIQNKRYSFKNSDIENILSNFNNISNLLDFIKENKEFLDRNKVVTHEIVKKLTPKKQIEFVTEMDDRISVEEQLKSLTVLSEEVKQKIDRTGMSERFVQILDMKIVTDTKREDFGYLDIDLEEDLSKYKDLDELIRIIPQKVPIDKYNRIYELMEICPKLKVKDNLNLCDSTVDEFKNGEKWIKEVLSYVNDDWPDIKKMAYIDYCIGKKISYTPNFNTEEFKAGSARALWKIIDSGYGICNGISQIEQYLLKRVGIESELVSSGKHTFLKVKNIEIPKEDGTTVIGDTIIDPTWNLTAHRYGGYPNLFAKSYEEIRKFDILADGTDKKSHKNDEAFKNGTVNVEEGILRNIYRSLGLTDEIGHFLISSMLEKCDEIAKQNIPLPEKIKKELDCLSFMHPDFSTCQNSTISILSNNILNHANIKFDRLVINRVYNRQDESKKASIFVYYSDSTKNEGFFVAEPGDKSFAPMNKEEFIRTYECYEEDIKKYDGIRPWESNAKETEIDLNSSSGNITSVNQEKKLEGEER